MAITNNINFYQYIHLNFGPQIMQLFKSYATNNRKLANITSRKKFLVRCRRRGVFPVHIANSFKCVFALLEQNSPYIKQLHNSICKFKRTILNIEIKQTYNTMETLKKQLTKLKEQMTQLAPADKVEDFVNTQHKFFEYQLTTADKRTKDKFARLLCSMIEFKQPVTITPNTRAIHNTTTKSLPIEAEILLSLGPKFSMPYRTISEIPFFHVIADLENVLHISNDKTIRDRNRCKSVNIVQNFVHQYDSRPNTPLGSFVKHAAKVTQRFIKENPDVVIVESDKGKQTVLMYESEYDSRMRALLNDQDTYKQIKQNPTSGYQLQNNNLVKRLLNLGLIDKETAACLSVNNAQCPKIYGLPKTHKPNLPLRPVVSKINAPSYTLSKFIGNIIRLSIDSKYNIKDSFSFCQFINQVSLPEGYGLISFDVVSLFTCIPRKLVTHTIIAKWQQIKTKTDINLDLFLEIVLFCLDSSYFSYRNTLYKQLDGTAMGDPLSPTIADLVMECLLDTVTSNIGVTIPFIKKYVDDLILALPLDKVEDILNWFNNYNENIQFTSEIEINRRLPYLDMVLVRLPDQTIRTEWYCKPMASGRFLDYHSSHPLHMKLNMVANFINRVRALSTNLSDREINSIIDKQLKINHYPSTLRHRFINKRQKLITNNETHNTEQLYKPMLYVEGLTSQLQKSLRIDFPNVMLACRNQHTVKKNFTRLKDVTPTAMKNNCIYSVPCADCGAKYIGLTTTLLKKRISNHKSNIKKLENLMELKSGNQNIDNEIELMREKTALLQHSIDEQHQFNLDGVRIIDQHGRESALKILEVCHIHNTAHTVNKRTDVDSLSSTYTGLLDSIKDRARHKHKI